MSKADHEERHDDGPQDGVFRRQFLAGIAAAAGTLPLLGGAADAAATAGNCTQPKAAVTRESGSRDSQSGRGYESLSLDEAAFVEALVNVMCPADGHTPSGVDCGLATYIDRQLAGGYGKGERLYMRGPWQRGKPEFGYQLPLTPEQYFKTGVAVANRACHARHGKEFAELSQSDADAFLDALSKETDEEKQFSLSSWFNQIVYPLFVEACYADPIYGGNRDKVFWKLIGYPGLPATHTTDMTEFRGKPYPGRNHPKAIPDFS